MVPLMFVQAPGAGTRRRGRRRRRCRVRAAGGRRLRRPARPARSPAARARPGRWRGWVVDCEAGNVEIAAGHLVTGDRPVADGLVHLAGGKRVAVRGGDPGVENLVAGPDSDDDGVAAWGGGFADELGEDAVMLADGATGVDPGQVAVVPFGRD